MKTPLDKKMKIKYYYKVYLEEDVREAIKNILERIDEYGTSDYIPKIKIIKIIKQEVGDGLI